MNDLHLTRCKRLASLLGRCVGMEPAKPDDMDAIPALWLRIERSIVWPVANSTSFSKLPLEKPAALKTRGVFMALAAGTVGQVVVRVSARLTTKMWEGRKSRKLTRSGEPSVAI